MRKRSNAAKRVRRATTVMGGIPNNIAFLPNTGAIPRKNAEDKAAEIPFIRPFIVDFVFPLRVILFNVYPKSYPVLLYQNRINFSCEVLIEEFPFLHEGVNSSIQTFFRFYTFLCSYHNFNKRHSCVVQNNISSV